MRRKTKEVKVGKVIIGGNSPISIQSMSKTFTQDVKSTVKQIKTLEEAGCQIIRVAVPDEEAAKAIKEIKKQISIPLVADIHFDYRLALTSINSGADKIRINPGNIGNSEKIKLVVAEAKKNKIPIRIGVNSGSLEKEILARYKGVTAEAMVESAGRHIKILEDLDFSDMVVSLKASSVKMTVEAYRLLAKKVDYPFHIGITEAGPLKIGLVRSAIGIGLLLSEGIGDTLRVSLTADPVEEVRAGYEILKSLEILNQGVMIISCPTCGRCEIDIESIATEIEKKTRRIKMPLKVAIMGCVVNGPGEAKDADVGLAAGKGVGLIFRKGEVVRKVSEAEMVEALLDEIESMAIR